MRVEFKDVEGAELVYIHADAHTVICRTATDDDKLLYRAEYQAFLRPEEAPPPKSATLDTRKVTAEELAPHVAKTAEAEEEAELTPADRHPDHRKHEKKGKR